MGLTSQKEHHIIKCLGLVHREEECGMSLADREWCYLLGNTYQKLHFLHLHWIRQSCLCRVYAAGGDTGRRGQVSDPPPRSLHCPLNLSSFQTLAYMTLSPIDSLPFPGYFQHSITPLPPYPSPSGHPRAVLWLVFSRWRISLTKWSKNNQFQMFPVFVGNGFSNNSD